MIELLVFDVDGCLSDGTITHTQNGDELKSFNVKDGLAITTWIKMGKNAAIITGRKSKIVEKRAKELGIYHVHQGTREKKKKLDEILQKENLTYEQVAVIGDDLNDYHMLKCAKISFCPNDSSTYIKQMVDHILKTNGGKGAIREMIEMIIDKENLKEEFLNQWL